MEFADKIHNSHISSEKINSAKAHPKVLLTGVFSLQTGHINKEHLSKIPRLLQMWIHSYQNIWSHENQTFQLIKVTGTQYAILEKQDFTSLQGKLTK